MAEVAEDERDDQRAARVAEREARAVEARTGQRDLDGAKQDAEQDRKAEGREAELVKLGEITLDLLRGVFLVGRPG